MFQVELKSEGNKRAAFFDADKWLIQFTKMPQGFENKPAIFQRGMQIVFGGLVNRTCLCYLDYILIFGRNIEKHDRNLKLV